MWVKAAWAVALVVSFNVYWPGYRIVVDSPYRIGDFFQEWASARNHFEGLPVYTPQRITAWRYLGQVPDTTKQVFVQMNGHPPPSVLLALPFAKLDYAVAYWLWNLLSVAAFFGAAAIALKVEVGTARSWYWLPILTIAFGNPMMEHVILGQLTTLVLLLIVGAAAADKNSRPALAGILIGTAAAIKLYPGLLFLYFVTTNQRRAIVYGLIAFVAWHLVTAAMLSTATYEDFVLLAMPEVLRYRDWVLNFSITGLWYKIFDGSSGQSVPIRHSPTTAVIGALICNAIVVGLATWAAFRTRKNPEARQSSLATMIVAMILVSPIAWDHYFLLLLWPLLRFGRATTLRAVPFWSAVLMFLWINPLVLLSHAAGTGVAEPHQVLGLISAPFYAVALLYAAGVFRTMFAASAYDAIAPLPVDDAAPRNVPLAHLPSAVAQSS